MNFPFGFMSNVGRYIDRHRDINTFSLKVENHLIVFLSFIRTDDQQNKPRSKLKCGNTNVSTQLCVSAEIVWLTNAMVASSNSIVVFEEMKGFELNGFWQSHMIHVIRHHSVCSNSVMASANETDIFFFCFNVSPKRKLNSGEEKYNLFYFWTSTKRTQFILLRNKRVKKKSKQKMVEFFFWQRIFYAFYLAIACCEQKH